MANIISGIIGAVGAIVAAWLNPGDITEYLLEEDKNRMINISYKDTKNEDNVMYKWRAEKLVSSMKVINKNGDSELRKKWRGVTTSKDASVQYIDGNFWTLTPNGKISRPPKLVHCNDIGKVINFEEVKESINRHRFALNIVNGLTKRDDELNFDVLSTFKENVTMDSSKVEKAYRNDPFKYEYLSYDIVAPTKELLLKVDFPNSINPSFHKGVFLANSEVGFDGALHDTEGEFETAGNEARWSIMNPCVGLRYIIYWEVD
jgi:hypothetical protein